MVALSLLAWMASWIRDLLERGQCRWATSKSQMKPNHPPPTARVLVNPHQQMTEDSEE